MKGHFYTKIALSTLILVFFLGACKEQAATDTNKVGQTGNPAIDQLTALIAQNPKNDSLYAARAALFYENDIYEEAVNDLARAMQIDSNNVDYHHLLADVYMDFTKSRLALNTMERAAQLHPTRIPTLLKLAEFQNILKFYDPSLKTIDQILQLDASNSEAYYMLGRNMSEMGDTARAINSYQKSFDYDDQNLDACISLGLLWERKNSPKALNYYDAALRIDSSNVFAMYSKAMYYQNRYEDDKAIDIYKKINVLDPDYTEAFFNTGILLLERDSLKQAYNHFNIVVNKDPLAFNGYYYRGVASEKMGNKAAALSDYQQAYKMSPGFTKAKEASERLAK